MLRQRPDAEPLVGTEDLAQPRRALVAHLVQADLSAMDEVHVLGVTRGLVDHRPGRHAHAARFQGWIRENGLDRKGKGIDVGVGGEVVHGCLPRGLYE